MVALLIPIQEMAKMVEQIHPPIMVLEAEEGEEESEHQIYHLHPKLRKEMVAMALMGQLIFGFIYNLFLHTFIQN